MSSYPQTIQIPTSLGYASAIKEKQDDPWDITYPWGDERFYGSKPEAKVHMEANIAQNDGKE